MKRVLRRIFYEFLDKFLEGVCLCIRPECESCHVRKICERFERIKRQRDSDAETYH